ncbi:MAG: PHP domain-containing protein [Thermomicrobiales bacterium]|nr:PHP domain-containing protein [Thermomicrobiales bacterium]
MTISSNGLGAVSERVTIPARAPVDLHLHTLASDGAWTPSALIDHLANRGFRVAAVCDHDTQRSVGQAIELGKMRGVHVIPGVEVTCSWNDRQLHILCYGVRPDRTDADAAGFLALMRQIDLQLQDNAADAARRIEADGKPLPNLETVQAGRPLWPFHVLSAAIEMKHVPNLTKAAELVVALGGTFTADLPLGDVVAATHRAGGVCSIAHPGRADAVGIVSEADIDRIVAETGMDGLEAHYRSYSDQQTALYRRLAEERGMFVSVGSDSHAPHRPVNPRPWHAVWARDLLNRLGVDLLPLPDGEPDWIFGMDPEVAVPAPEPPPSPDPEPMETEADVAAKLGDA